MRAAGPQPPGGRGQRPGGAGRPATMLVSVAKRQRAKPLLAALSRKQFSARRAAVKVMIVKVMIANVIIVAPVSSLPQRDGKYAFVEFF
jgi:hypothetical protein